MKNVFSNFYLYAKGWYEKSNTLEDLKRITSVYSGVSQDYITERDVRQVLLNIVRQEICKSEYAFSKFVEVMETDGFYASCLAVLRNSMIKECGRPDSNVLPYDFEVTDELIDNREYNWAN
jgi:hypothetical protein